MPLYEYTCQGCKGKFTLLQSIATRPAETVCPLCGGREVRRLFSTFSSKTEGVPSPSLGGGGHAHGGGCGCG